MNKVNSNIIIISLGGSLIVPEEINIKYLRKFKEIILRQIKKGKKFIIFCGGGKTARKYMDAVSGISGLTKDDVDWLGIYSTILNAHLLRTIFKEHSSPDIVRDPTKKISYEHKIIFASGWKPGWSTDYDAVLMAKNIGAKEIINLSNIDYVYDKDPKKYKDAKPIKKISWKEFRKITGNEWKPGLNLPFDPVASKEAEKIGLKVIIMNGSNLENFEKYLNKEEFIGTVIE